ncbi:LacI family DNA-binding transcriptional regulator [Dactylosporangium sp. AC04546]|uniref:LacI family DNA-binding transcriptional regulator n=1 Tax=Dactylosporangium sp. AC04546 TaxID=2862460 RepID=UPI001EDFC3BC|nr:LacI family DNA-binding transcriptional regulator [Dactylosporangium sp. AC04546]WVK80547.1 LacI family DNA-binding transcriptional regulator [Dactylosporangium sp. AC04546]
MTEVGAAHTTDDSMTEGEKTAGGVPNQTRPLVMSDVAAAAGVSAQTVSRVLNDHPHVKRETRERVLAAVRELGYQLNSSARALRTGRTRTIGVITFDAVRYGPASVLQSIGQATQEAGYAICVAPLRSLDQRSLRDAVDLLTGQAVDGMITIAPHRDMARALLNVSANVPMVALDDSFDPHVAVVTVDEAAGARQATEYLLQLGHRTVWHIAGPTDSIAADGRVSGWRSALVDAGVPVPAVLVGDWEARAGYELGRDLADRDDVTAVLAANDQMALGLLRALSERGRRVPQDVSVVGFDDIPEAAYLVPPLTTIRPNFQEIGRRCVQVLLRRIGGDDGRPLRSQIQPELIVRRSTGAPPRI